MALSEGCIHRGGKVIADCSVREGDREAVFDKKIPENRVLFGMGNLRGREIIVNRTQGGWMDGRRVVRLTAMK